MPRNPANPTPKNAPCEGYQFDENKEYYDLQYADTGWIPRNGESFDADYQSGATPVVGDAGRFRSTMSVSDYADAKSYGYQLPESEDRGQNPVVERIAVDISMSPKNRNEY